MSDDLLQPGPTHRLEDGTILSVQRLTTGGSPGADEISTRYFKWLPGLFFTLIRARFTGPVIDLRLFGVTLLSLRAHVITPLRAHHDIIGGVLAKTPGGALIFLRRPASDDLLAIVQGFRPRLPWWIYASTQRPLHVWTMRRFAALLARTSPPDTSAQETP